jgi:hypothetical protein
MNNQTLRDKPSAFHSYLITSLLLHIYTLTAILIFTAAAFAQTATWRYVATLPGGIKNYLNDEVKTLLNENSVRWEKMIKSDGSSATALVEWNCPSKLRLIRQITFYNSDQSVIGTKKKGFEWSPIIPGSSADFLYRRVCSAITLQTAEITASQADLRAFPDNTAPIVKAARRGDKFQIVPGSGEDGWFNVVDAATQEDYWLLRNQFKTIEGEQQPKKQSAATAPAVTKRKPQKPRLRKKRNEKLTK